MSLDRCHDSQEINIKLRVLNELFLEGITDIKKMHRNDVLIYCFKEIL